MKNKIGISFMVLGMSATTRVMVRLAHPRPFSDIVIERLISLAVKLTSQPGSELRCGIRVVGEHYAYLKVVDIPYLQVAEPLPPLMVFTTRLINLYLFKYLCRKRK